MCLLTQ